MWDNRYIVNSDGENDMTSKLVIIGNGFDLCHGLKTNYRDFLESEYCSDQLKKGLSEIEDYVKTKQNIEDEGINLWTDMEYMYYRAMVSIDEEDFTKVENFNNIIEKFKMEFMRYLDNCLQYDEVKKRDDLQLLLNEADWILDFNYTNTIEAVYGISDPKKHIKVHGSIKDNYIVLGFPNTYSSYNDHLKKFIEDINSDKIICRYNQNTFNATLSSYSDESIARWNGEKIWQRILLEFHRFKKAKIDKKEFQELSRWFNNLDVNRPASDDFVNGSGYKLINSSKSPRTEYQGDIEGYSVPLGYQYIFRYTNMKFSEGKISVTVNSKLVREFLEKYEGIPGLIDVGDLFNNDIDIAVIGHALRGDIEIFKQIQLISNRIYHKKINEIIVYVYNDKEILSERARKIFCCQKVLERKYKGPY